MAQVWLSERQSSSSIGLQAEAELSRKRLLLSTKSVDSTGPMPSMPERAAAA